MSKPVHLQFLGYSIAILSVITALLLMLLLDPWVTMAKSPFLIFFGAVMISAWWGGLKPGLVATLLSALLSAHFFLPPADSMQLNLGDSIRTGIFVLQGLLFSVLSETLRNTNQQLKTNLRSLQQSQKQYQQSQDALQNALQKLMFHVENSPLAVVEWERDYRIVRWSPQAETIFGWKATEIIGKKTSEWQFVHPDDLEEVQRVNNYLVNGTQQRNMVQNRNYTKSGSIVYCEWYNSALLDETGQVVSVFCLVLDVTARIRVEQELQAANRRTASILESISDAFVAFDHQWRYTYINETAAQLLQKSPRELLGNQIWQINAACFGNSFEQKAHQAMAEQLPFAYEEFSPALNCWLEINGYPSTESLAVYFRDINERKQAESTLRQSEERLRLALDVGNAGVWDWDILNNRVTWSDRIYEFHGLTPETFAGSLEAFAALIYPDDRQQVEAAVHQTLATQSPYQIEFRIVQPNGEVRWLSTTGGVICDSDGKPIRMLGATTDITQRKLVEVERDSLLKAEQTARVEAETANRMKDEFLATLSHELRSPLNAILGWTNLLRSRQLDETTVSRALETIERNARSQVQLIEDLLDVSRIIRGQLRLDVQTTSLISVIEAALDSVRPAAEAKNIRLQSVLDPAAGPVFGDPNRLQQVVWNLLSNAVKFTPKNGRVQICLQRINSHVEIVVSDTGKGIHSAFLPYVFERFRQADSSSTRSYGGLGLGLAIVRHLVELHGGTVHANSFGEGQGSTFTVQLPLSAVNLKPEPERVHPTVSNGLPFTETTKLNGLRILLVDDEKDVSELLTEILEVCGATVVAVSNADAAIKTLTKAAECDTAFDILISDIGMPEQDGYVLIRRVRALSPNQGGRIPAIAFTAYARAEDRRAILLAGFQAHVAKPAEPAELTAVIASVVGRTNCS